MRWPFRYKRQLSDAEGIEKAKAARAMAQLLEEHATRSQAIHEDIRRRNNLRVKFDRALGGLE